MSKEDIKRAAAVAAAKKISEAASILDAALEIMEKNDLNLENYPEAWSDFNEHPAELRNLFVADFDKDSVLQIGVGTVEDLFS